MSTHLTRKITFAILLGSLSIASARASGTDQRSILHDTQVTFKSVTGGDPEPTSPKIIHILLAILHLE
jgi:hypothetical protein